MQGVLVLADAINRAGSTIPRRSASAGRDRLGRIAGGHALGWREVRRQGAEHRGAGLILELKGAGYQTVWPEKYRSDKSLPTLPFSWK